MSREFERVGFPEPLLTPSQWGSFESAKSAYLSVELLVGSGGELKTYLLSNLTKNQWHLSCALSTLDPSTRQVVLRENAFQCLQTLEVLKLKSESGIRSQKLLIESLKVVSVESVLEILLANQVNLTPDQLIVTVLTDDELMERVFYWTREIYPSFLLRMNERSLEAAAKTPHQGASHIAGHMNDRITGQTLASDLLSRIMRAYFQELPRELFVSPWECMGYLPGYIRQFFQSRQFAHAQELSELAALDWARFQSLFSPQDERKEKRSLRFEGTETEVLLNPTLQVVQLHHFDPPEMRAVFRHQGELKESILNWQEAALIDELLESGRMRASDLLLAAKKFQNPTEFSKSLTKLVDYGIVLGPSEANF